MSYRDYDPIRELSRVRPENQFHGVNPAMEDSITYAHDPLDIEAKFRGERGEDFHVYGRFSHPSLRFLSRQFVAIEDASTAIAFATGQAAMAAIFASVCQPGDHVVVSNRLYGGTVSFIDTQLITRNIRVTRVDITDHHEVKKALEEEGTKLLFVESVSNPSLVACDIGKLAKLAHKTGVLMAVDNTFMPLAVLPLRLGADIVMHSLTKFASGQSDLLGGILCFGCTLSEMGVGKKPSENKKLIDRFRSHLSLHGAVLYHGTAHEVSKRMPHLRIRFKEASNAALCVADALVRAGIPVHYPGLAQYPHRKAMDANLITRDLGFGAMIAADLRTPERAMEFARRLEKAGGGYSAVSLGSSHTYVCAPLASVHCRQADEQKAGKANHRAPPELTEGLVRIACGYDLPPRILADLLLDAIPK